MTKEATFKSMKLDHLLTPYTEINSKCIEDLNVRLETIKLLGKKKTGRNFFDIDLSNIFLDMFPRTREMEAKISYWDHIKIKSFCMTKEPIDKMRRQPTWEKILQIIYLIRD